MLKKHLAYFGYYYNLNIKDLKMTYSITMNYHSMNYFSERHILILFPIKFVLFAVMDLSFTLQLSFTLGVFLKYLCHDINMIHASRKNRNSKNGNITKQAPVSPYFE